MQGFSSCYVFAFSNVGDMGNSLETFQQHRRMEEEQRKKILTEQYRRAIETAEKLFQLPKHDIYYTYMWEQCREGWKKNTSATFPAPPNLTNNILKGVSKEEVAQICTAMGSALMRWARAEWPVIPTRLCRKLEDSGEFLTVMHWEMEIAKSMFPFYRGRFKFDVEKCMPSLGWLFADYTEEDYVKLHAYGRKVALVYIWLCPQLAVLGNAISFELEEMLCYFYMSCLRKTCKLARRYMHSRK